MAERHAELHLADRRIALDGMQGAEQAGDQRPVGRRLAQGGETIRREQINFKRAIHATEIFGRVWPAIELTTAAGVCAMVDLHRLGKLPQKGFVKQEDCSLATFNETIFGLAYERPEGIEAAVRG